MNGGTSERRKKWLKVMLSYDGENKSIKCSIHWAKNSWWSHARKKTDKSFSMRHIQVDSDAIFMMIDNESNFTSIWCPCTRFVANQLWIWLFVISLAMRNSECSHKYFIAHATINVDCKIAFSSNFNDSRCYKVIKHQLIWSIMQIIKKWSSFSWSKHLLRALIFLLLMSRQSNVARYLHKR